MKMQKKKNITAVVLVLVLFVTGFTLFFLLKPKASDSKLKPHTSSYSTDLNQISTKENHMTNPAAPDNTWPSGDAQPDNNFSVGKGDEPILAPADAQKIGFFFGTEADMKPEVAEAFAKEGCTVLHSFEMPETPETVPVYKAENRENDVVGFMNAVFGEEVDCESQTLSDNRGTLYYTTWHGAQYQIMDCGTFRDGYRRLAVRRTSLPAEKTANDPAAEARSFAEKLTQNSFFQGFQVEPELYYSCLYQTSVVACKQYISGYPISSDTYYIEEDNDTWNIEGSILTVEYDAYGLNGVEFKRPLSVTETGAAKPVRVSAEMALKNAISQAKQKYTGHRVIDIREVSLEYLSPAHDGDQMIPVWVIRYDLYQKALRPGSVEFDVGELVFIVEVETGYVYPIYL